MLFETQLLLHLIVSIDCTNIHSPFHVTLCNTLLIKYTLSLEVFRNEILTASVIRPGKKSLNVEEILISAFGNSKYE